MPPTEPPHPYGRYSERTRQLLEDLDRHAARTRFVIASLLVIGLLSIAVNINQKAPAGNGARIDARFYNDLLHGKDIPDRIERDSMDREFDTWIDWIYMHRERDERLFLERLQLLQLEAVQIPILGYHLSGSMAGLVGASAALLLYVWLCRGLAKERSILSHLFYPLVAGPDDEKARILWNRPLEESSEKQRKAREDAIVHYREEAIGVRESVSASFLLVNSRFQVSLLISLLLVVSPAAVLYVHAHLDWEWDFEREWALTGLTFARELEDYADQMESKWASACGLELAEATPTLGPCEAVERGTSFDRLRTGANELRSRVESMRAVRESQRVIAISAMLFAAWALWRMIEGVNLLRCVYLDPRRRKPAIEKWLDVPRTRETP